MNETNITLYKRPQTPDENNCCGNGCNPCIFDIHMQLLNKWKINKYLHVNIDKEKNNLIIPLSYKSFIIYDKKIINRNYMIIHLRYNEQYDNDKKIYLNPGQHVIINILSWSKPFTPISWNDNTLIILIRIYSTGVNTNKLMNIELNSEIKVRGPYGDFQYIHNKYDNIIMFGIGSGIAALYPIAKSIIDDDNDETWINLNFGFQSLDQVPLMKELKLLADYWNVIFTLYITQSSDDAKFISINIKYERINENIFESTVKKYNPEKTLILICGNNEFNVSLETWSKKYYYTNYYIFK